MSRNSTESDARHLLSDNASIAPSIATGLFPSYAPTPCASTDTARPTNTTRPAPINIKADTTPATPTPYRGFPSQEAYLEALKAWAETKQYIQLDTAMHGWYGEKTQEYYVMKDGGPEVRKQRKQEKKVVKEERKAEKQEKKAERKERRATVANVQRTVTGESEGGEGAPQPGEARRKFSLGQWPRRNSKVTLTQSR